MLRQSENVRGAIGTTTHVSFADFEPIQISTRRDRGLEVRRREQFVFGTRRLRSCFHGSQELMSLHGTDLLSRGSSAPNRTVDTPTPPKKKDKARDKDYYGSNRGNNDSDRRGNDGGGRGGGSRGVHFDDRNKGILCRTDIVTHLSCNCGGSDINSTYRQCLVSLSASSTYFTALTLFDTGAYTSFVNREVAKWLGQRQEGDKEGLDGNRTSSRHDIPTTVVGLAGTTMNSSVYGSVVFDLTLFNEVTRYT